MALETKEKKRKAATPVTVDAPQPRATKKSKAASSKHTDDDAAAAAAAPPSGASMAAPTASSITEAQTNPKVKSRKRAVDFLSDDEGKDGGVSVVEPAGAELSRKDKPKTKKAKKDKLAVNGEAGETTEKASTSLPPKKKGPSTADVHAEKIKKLLGQKDDVPKQKKISKKVADGAKEAASTSLEVEAQRTTEEEPQDKYDSEEETDQAGALLEGFDSDTEDLAQDEGFDKDKPTKPLPDYKKTQKKLRQAAQKGNKEGPGTVYVGRIPHGFYETEMRQYFSQFGTITKLRLSRNRKTGHSKHFAFLEFQSNEVAKIVAETMDNYLMYGHILKCKYVLQESLHPDTFKGANKRFRVAPHNRMEKRALEAPKSESQWTKKNAKEQAKREKKAEQLKAMGYEIELPKLKDPSDVLQQKESQTTTGTEQPDPTEVASNEVPVPAAVPKDEVAIKKKSKKEENGKSSTAEANGERVPIAAPSADSSMPVQPQSSTEKKPKKEKKGEKTVNEANSTANPTEVLKTDTTDPAAPRNGVDKKSKKEKKVKTPAPDINVATSLTTALNDKNPKSVPSSNGLGKGSEQREKRKEKRDKVKEEAKQIGTALAADGIAPKMIGQPVEAADEAMKATADSAKAKQKPKQKKNAKGDAPMTTDEAPAPAPANSEVITAEKEPRPSAMLGESVKEAKSKNKSRKRKNSVGDGEQPESGPALTEPGVSSAKEQKANGEGKTKSILKKAKKA